MAGTDHGPIFPILARRNFGSLKITPLLATARQEPMAELIVSKVEGMCRGTTITRTVPVEAMAQKPVQCAGYAAISRITILFIGQLAMLVTPIVPAVSSGTTTLF